MWSYLSGRLISGEGLHHLDDYSFHGQDHSWLAAHGLNDYWNWVVEFVPLWVAPNVLTALGFLCQLVGFVAMSYYNPDFETPVAPWVYFLCAGGLFAYQTLDNIDGKQARRTKSSSPLGELFDHVSDAMGVGTMITTVGASCRVGPVVTLVVFFSVITPFFLYHWEEYYTGELILGEFDGPTESQMFVIVLHVMNGVCAMYHYDFWSREIVLGYRADVVFPAAFCCLCGVASVRLQVRMWRHAYGTLRHSAVEIVGVGLPFLTFLASALTYCYYRPELLQHHRWDESRLLFFVLTALFGYITSRLIVQRVCKERAPVMYPINLPLFVAALHAVLQHHAGVPDLLDSHRVLKVMAVLALVQCVIFFRALNNELTAYLGIHTFRLSKQPWVRKVAPGVVSPKEGRRSVRTPSPKAKQPEKVRSSSPKRSKAVARKTAPGPAPRLTVASSRQSVSPRRKRPEVERLQNDLLSLPIRVSDEESPRRGRSRSPRSRN